MVIEVNSEQATTLVVVERKEQDLTKNFGGLAQLARAPALHAGGQRFESVILHPKTLELKNLRTEESKN